MRIKHLGAVNLSDLELNKLLVFTGNNNSGKTYTSYLLYGLLSALIENNFFKVIEKSFIKEFLKNNEKRELRIEKEKVEAEYVNQAINFLNNNEKLMDILINNFKISKKNFEKFRLEVTEKDVRSILGDFCSKENSNYNIIEGIELEVEADSDVYIISKRGSFNEERLERFLENKINIEFLVMRLSYNLINIPNVVYFPAERNGINVFKDELNENRLKTYDTIMTT